MFQPLHNQLNRTIRSFNNDVYVVVIRLNKDEKGRLWYAMMSCEKGLDFPTPYFSIS